MEPSRCLLIPSLLVLGSKAGPVPKGRARREISTFKALGKLKEDVWAELPAHDQRETAGCGFSETTPPHLHKHTEIHTG